MFVEPLCNGRNPIYVDHRNRTKKFVCTSNRTKTRCTPDKSKIKGFVQGACATSILRPYISKLEEIAESCKKNKIEESSDDDDYDLVDLFIQSNGALQRPAPRCVILDKVLKINMTNPNEITFNKGSLLIGDIDAAMDDARYDTKGLRYIFFLGILISIKHNRRSAHCIAFATDIHKIREIGELGMARQIYVFNPHGVPKRESEAHTMLTRVAHLFEFHKFDLLFSLNEGARSDSIQHIERLGIYGTGLCVGWSLIICMLLSQVLYWLWEHGTTDPSHTKSDIDSAIVCVYKLVSDLRAHPDQLDTQTLHRIAYLFYKKVYRHKPKNVSVVTGHK